MLSGLLVSIACIIATVYLTTRCPHHWQEVTRTVVPPFDGDIGGFKGHPAAAQQFREWAREMYAGSTTVLLKCSNCGATRNEKMLGGSTR